MTKYYRVVKDHPMWEVGAILSNEYDSDEYRPMDDLFVKEFGQKNGDDWFENAGLVENQKEFFERVYKVSILKQAKYLTKTEARKVTTDLYKGK